MFDKAEWFNQGTVQCYEAQVQTVYFHSSMVDKVDIPVIVSEVHPSEISAYFLS